MTYGVFVMCLPNGGEQFNLADKADADKLGVKLAARR